MSWVAILLAAAVVAAAGPAPRKHHHRVAPSLRAAKKAPLHKGLRIKRQAVGPRPSASPVPAGATPVVVGASPTPTATPTATPTPAPTPVYPSRTKVILKDDPYSVQSSYVTMKAGPLEFNVVNNGMDDHNLTVKGVAGATVDVPAGDPENSYALDVTLTPGSYTLYCSLPGHEALGMWTTLTVK